MKKISFFIKFIIKIAFYFLIKVLSRSQSRYCFAELTFKPVEDPLDVGDWIQTKVNE